MTDFFYLGLGSLVNGLQTLHINSCTYMCKLYADLYFLLQKCGLPCKNVLSCVFFKTFFAVFASC